MSEICPNPQMMEWLLGGYWEFADPRSFLPKISSEVACRRIEGVPYTIAELLAHALWWQKVRLNVARGGEYPEFNPSVDDWPLCPSDDWERVVGDFLSTLEDMIALSGDSDATGREVFGDRNAGFMLVSHATHNAYHLGQIALILKMTGEWNEAPKDE